jgi:hypothetical protein
MKKSILLSILTATTLLNATDFQYETPYPSGYTFGFSGIFQANNAELDNGISGDNNYGWGFGIDTYQTYEVTDRIFVGIKAGGTYMFDTGYLDADAWGVYAEPRIGFKATQQIHLYVGAGYQYDSFDEYEDDDYGFFDDPEKKLDYSIDGPYVSVGMDYTLSKDLIIGLKYSRGFDLSIDNEQAIGDLYKINQDMDQNKFQVEVTIPFR